MKEKILNILKESSKLLLMFIVIILIYTTLLWFIKIEITAFHLPIEFIITVALYLTMKYLKTPNNIKSNGKNIKNKIKENLRNKDIRKILLNNLLIIILASIVFSACVFVSTWIYDTTADGNTYHKLAIGCMKNGWNPIYESCRDFTKEDGNVFDVSADNRNYLWADHYAIGTEIIGANVYSFTNHIESGKVFTLIMMYSTFGIFLYYLAVKKKINIIISIIISFVIVVNPITVTQMGTFYVDAVLLLSLCLIIYELIKITNEKNNLEYPDKKEDYFILALSIIICANAKFTGLAFAAIFCFAFYVYWLIEKGIKNKTELGKEFRNLTIYYIVVVSITIFIVGFSSYAKNLFQHGHPMYPLYGKGHVENMVNMEAPKSFKGKNHIETFLISLFAKGENVSPSYSNENNQPDLKIPFTFSKEELNNYKIPDIRMSGFGPLFSGIVLIGLVVSILMVVDYVKNKKWKDLTIYSIISGIVLVLILALDGNYWARYIPYLYVLPIINLIYLALKKDKKTNVLLYGMLFIVLLNSLLITRVSLKGYVENTRYSKNNLSNLRVLSQNQNEPIKIKLNHIGLQGILYNLDDLKIKFEVVEELENIEEKEGFFFKY